MMSKHLAVTQNRKASLAADRGESATPYHPSNSSTVSAAGGSKSFVESPMPVHSKHRAKAIEHYSKNTVEASYVRPSATKMTRTEHQLNNQEDMSEKGHKL